MAARGRLAVDFPRALAARPASLLAKAHRAASASLASADLTHFCRLKWKNPLDALGSSGFFSVKFSPQGKRILRLVLSELRLAPAFAARVTGGAEWVWRISAANLYSSSWRFWL
jgi:hypothetical protein